MVDAGRPRCYNRSVPPAVAPLFHSGGFPHGCCMIGWRLNAVVVVMVVVAATVAVVVADDEDRPSRGCCAGRRERLQRAGQNLGLLRLGRVGEVGEDEVEEGEGALGGVGRSLERYRGPWHPSPGLAFGAPGPRPDAPAPVADRVLLGSRARDYELLRGREVGAAWGSYGSSDHSRLPRS